MLSDTRSLEAFVLRRLAVSQFSNIGGSTAKEKRSAIHNKAYRTLNASSGGVPADHVRNRLLEDIESARLK